MFPDEGPKKSKVSYASAIVKKCVVRDNMHIAFHSDSARPTPFRNYCYLEHMAHVIESANPVVKALIEQTAPRPALVAASRGILPLPQSDLLEVLVAFARSDDAELAADAVGALAAQRPDEIEHLFHSEEAAASVLGYFAADASMPAMIHSAIIANRKTPAEAIVKLARTTANANLLDSLSLNQQLLISAPAIIDAVIANPNRTAEAERRVVETKLEFFEKERGLQQIAGELRAQGKEAAAEFIEKAEFARADASSTIGVEDAVLLAAMIEVPDRETDDSWLGLELIEELYEETPEQRQALASSIVGELRMDAGEISDERISVINRVIKMSMKDRVKLAMKGNREARNILIRDPNRIVSQAVINNPRITEQEVEKIASMRSVTEEILRHIATDRQWARSYSIIHNLARNPRTPIANVMSILTRMQLRDLAALSKNRNVSDAVRRQALRLSQARTGK